jgi:AcrR family transcriptional regulator
MQVRKECEAALPEVPGLRERKKQRTRETIAAVALELFERQGFRATTIAQIAEAADVSPRTVSSYFPVKEELLFPRRRDAFGRLRERLANRLPGELAADALRAWIVDNFDQMEDERTVEAERARRRVIDGDESLRAWERGAMEEGEQLLAAAVAHDLGVAPDDVSARLAAAATMAALTTLSRYDEEGDARGARLDPQAHRATVLALLDQAIVFLRGGIRELQAAKGAAGPIAPSNREG